MTERFSRLYYPKQIFTTVEIKGKWMKKRIFVIVLVIFVIFLANWLMLKGYVSHAEKKRADVPGNADVYDIENLEKNPNSVLTGKNILFLGSSVTRGDGAKGKSFVELFQTLDGVNAIKEAKSGTTLVDKKSMWAMVAYGNGNSYIKRLKKIKTDTAIDCVLCQLSTNDATKKLPLGEVSSSRDLSSFDTKTITGAIEYIIKYCQDTWHCPVVFYTGSYFENAEYQAMVTRLYQLQDKWDFTIIDLYTDKDFNQIDTETYNLYMYDSIHPTLAGYANWWFPKMESELIQVLEK